MAQEFDYFLILSALAFLAVILQIIRMVKGTSSNKTNMRKTEGPQTSSRKERIRSAQPKNFEIPKPHFEPPVKKPRMSRIEFYDQDGKIFAVLRRSDLTAQPWGRGEDISAELNQFADQYLPLGDNEALLLHIVNPKLNGTLTAKAFDEENNLWKETFNNVPSVEAFPCQKQSEIFSMWLKGQLTEDCSSRFFALPEAAQAAVMLSQVNDKETGADFDESTQLKLRQYQAYKLLEEIVKQNDFYQISALWNRYFDLKSMTPNDIVLVNPNVERLVNSQSFALTQKLPIFYIRDTKGCGKWHKALNF